MWDAHDAHHWEEKASSSVCHGLKQDFSGYMLFVTGNSMIAD